MDNFATNMRNHGFKKVNAGDFSYWKHENPVEIEGEINPMIEINETTPNDDDMVTFLSEVAVQA